MPSYGRPFPDYTGGPYSDPIDKYPIPALHTILDLADSEYSPSLFAVACAIRVWIEVTSSQRSYKYTDNMIGRSLLNDL